MVTVVNRKDVPWTRRYVVQTQAPAGNWVDNLSTNTESLAMSTALFEESFGRCARVVDNANGGEITLDELQRARAEAESTYGCDVIEVEQGASALHSEVVADGVSEAGVWVQAWLWVPASAYRDEEPNHD